MRFRTISTVLLTLSLLGIARADTLLIESVEQNVETRQARPTRGMTMERVESVFGEPSVRVGAVGDPPITRWEYPTFIVYFEHDRVIHAAIRH